MSDFVDKFYASREDELSHITEKDKKELLKLNPHYFGGSKFEEMIRELNNEELNNAFEDYKDEMNLSSSYFQKKFYLNGLKDGMKLNKFSKSK